MAWRDTERDSLSPSSRGKLERTVPPRARSCCSFSLSHKEDRSAIQRRPTTTSVSDRARSRPLVPLAPYVCARTTDDVRDRLCVSYVITLLSTQRELGAHCRVHTTFTYTHAPSLRHRAHSAERGAVRPDITRQVSTLL